MNLKPPNQYITFTKFKMTIMKQIRVAIHPGLRAVSHNIKSAYCHIQVGRRHHCFLCFRWRDMIYHFQSLTFGPLTVPKTLTRVMKSIHLWCQKMGTALFLYLDDALILADSYSQLKKDQWRVAQLLQRLESVLSLEKCQLEPTQKFTHLGLDFNTQDMTLSLPQDKMSSSSTWRVWWGYLFLQMLPVALPMASLHSHPLQSWLRETYRTLADLFRGLKPNSEATQPLLWWCSFKPQPKALHRPLV